MISISLLKRGKRIIELIPEKHQRENGSFPNNSTLEARYESSLESGFISVNQTFLKMFGFDSLEELNRVPIESLYGNALDRRYILEILVPNGEISNLQVEYKRKDGSSFWGLLNTRLDTGRSKQRIYRGVIFDVDSQIQAERKLAETQQLIESINQNISEGIYRISNEGLVYINNAFAFLFGYSNASEIISANSQVQFLLDNDKDFLSEVRSISQNIQNKEIHFKRNNGESFIGLLSCTINRQKSGEIYWDGALRDITHERMALLKIEESEHLLKSINRNINEAIYRSEKASGLIYINEAFIRMFGFNSYEEAIACNAIDLYKDPSERQRLGEEILRTGEATNIEVEFKRQSGEIFWGLLSSHTVSTEDGRVIFDGAIRDISKQKKDENTLLHQNARLKEFSYITSHNIRSSAANFIGLLDLLNEDQDNTRIIEMLKETADKLNVTINNINELLNFEYEFEQLKMLPCNLLESIQSALTLNSEKISKKSVIINLDIAKNLYVLGFPAFIDSIFHNLVTNALKYGITQHSRKISIRAKRLKGQIYIQIEDWGLGIDLEQNGHKIFMLGSRFHASKSKGQGLGLFMTKRQIEAMGGRIALKSNLNKGTIFKIWLNEYK